MIDHSVLKNRGTDYLRWVLQAAPSRNPSATASGTLERLVACFDYRTGTFALENKP
jgi:hypothetical protein